MVFTAPAHQVDNCISWHTANCEYANCFSLIAPPFPTLKHCFSWGYCYSRPFDCLLIINYYWWLLQAQLAQLLLHRQERSSCFIQDHLDHIAVRPYGHSGVSQMTSTIFTFDLPLPLKGAQILLPPRRAIPRCLLRCLHVEWSSRHLCKQKETSPSHL